MEEKEITKQVMYDWIEHQEEQLEAIRAHVDNLPEGQDGWNNYHFSEVAYMAAHLGMLAGKASFLHQGILGVLAEKIRIDAKLN